MFSDQEIRQEVVSCMAQSADGVPHLVKEYKECHQQTYFIKTLVGF